MKLVVCEGQIISTLTSSEWSRTRIRSKCPLTDTNIRKKLIALDTSELTHPTQQSNSARCVRETWEGQADENLGDMMSGCHVTARWMRKMLMSLNLRYNDWKRVNEVPTCIPTAMMLATLRQAKHFQTRHHCENLRIVSCTSRKLARMLVIRYTWMLTLASTCKRRALKDVKCSVLNLISGSTACHALFDEYK